MYTQWKDAQEETITPSPRLSSAALEVWSEALRLLVIESMQRSQDEARIEEETVVEPYHVAHILPQLFLDY